MTAPRSIRSLTALVALALALGLGANLPAHASSTKKKDPRGDVFLSSVVSGIDLAAVQFKTLERKERIRVTFRLHSPVLSEVSLKRPGGLKVEFIGNKRIRRVVSVATEDGVLLGEICSHSRGEVPSDPYDCSTLAVAQVDARTYRTVVGLDQVKEGAEVLRWTASSLDLSSHGTPVSDSLAANDRKPFRWRL